MQALILAGGFGTRLRSMVNDRPKCLAPVAGRPFLEYLVRAFLGQGVREFVFSVGYRAEQVEAEFGDGSRLGASIRYSRETEPLGTAGAIRLAGSLVPDDTFLAANGDSLLELDLDRLMRFHQARAAPVTLALVRVPDAGRYGTVEIDAENRVRSFREKTGRTEPGLVNGGVYALNRAVLETIPAGRAVSLERETLPAALDKGVYGMTVAGYFLDIGTPDDLARAQADPAGLQRVAGTAGRS